MPEIRCLVRSLVALSVLATAAACGAPQTAVDSPPMPDRVADEAAIRALIAGSQDAINNRDFAAFTAPFLPDADTIVLTRPKASGPEAIRMAMEAGWAAMPDRMITISVDAIRFIGPDTAVADSVATFSSGEPAVDRSTGVLVRRDGVWRVAALRVYAGADQ